MIPDSNSSPTGIAWLFHPSAGTATKRDIWLWWEKRRIFYNLVVVLTALISFTVYAVFLNRSGRLSAGEDVIEPIALLAAVIGGPIVWNVAYCLGPIVDIALSTGKPKTVGPLLLKLGLGFSISLISIPAVYWFAVAFLARH